MDKLGSSEANFKPPSPTQEQVDELERPLKSLEEEGVNPDADQELTDVLSATMGQLTSKDVLYEPIKKLYEKVCRVFQQSCCALTGHSFHLTLSPILTEPTMSTLPRIFDMQGRTGHYQWPRDAKGRVDHCTSTSVLPTRFMAIMLMVHEGTSCNDRNTSSFSAQR